VDGGVNTTGPFDFTQLLASVAITDPRPIFRRSLDADFNRPNAYGLSFHFLRRGPNSFLADDANANSDLCVTTPSNPNCKKNTVGNINNSLLYRVTDNVLFNFTSTYDVRDSRFIGFRTVTKFLSFCECWTVTFGVRHDVNPAKTSYSVDFSLLGLGSPKSSLK
jgi:hypothetical protein